MAVRKYEKAQRAVGNTSFVSTKVTGSSTSSFRAVYVALLATLVVASGLYFGGINRIVSVKSEQQTSRVTPPLKASPPQPAGRLQPQFAKISLQLAAASILEDYDMIKATNSDRERFKKDVAVEYIDYCKRRGLPAPSALEALEEPVEPKLSDPRYYDAYSYAQFKVAARYVLDPKARHRMTQRMGRRLFEMALALSQKTPTGESDDMEAVQDLLKTLLSTFKAWGYIVDGGIIWPETVAKDWKRGRVTFQYWMVDPVILPSAQALYEEEGFAQHFSSRTMEALFMAFGIVAHESAEFDPREFSKDRIVEQWELRVL